MMMTAPGDSNMNGNASSNVEENSSNSVDSVELVVSKFLLPLREDLEKEVALLDKTPDEEVTSNSTEDKKASDDAATLVNYFKALCKIIGGPNMLLMNKAVLKKVQVMMDQKFNIAQGQSDLEDYLDFKPSEIMAYKAIGIFCAFALPQPLTFMNELKSFQELMNDRRLAQDQVASEAYRFTVDVFMGMFRLLLPEKTCLKMEISGSTETEARICHELSPASQAIVEAMQAQLLKQFKLHPIKRLDMLKQAVKKDESNLDLCLYLADHLRLKRRDVSCREKYPSELEMNILGSAFSIAPDNPFVILSVLDTLIGNIRESSGRFFLGPIALNTVEDSMRYLQDKCAELAVKYPKNVMINSCISDYFARYVPLRYFDVDFSLKTLMAAYETNPGIAKTNHRLGIFYRMSLGKLDESLKWFTKAVELDPYHHDAAMEYFKSLLGKGEIEVGKEAMERKVKSSEFQSWSAVDQADLYFYLGIACFIKKDYDEMLNWWKEAIVLAEYPFNLVDLSETFMNYMENKSVVSIDLLKLWMHKKVESLVIICKRLNGQGRLDDTMIEKKALAQRIFQLMIGIGPKPGRKLVKDFPHRIDFPKEHAPAFTDLN